MIKRTIAFAFIISMVFYLSACSKGDVSSTLTGSQNSSVQFIEDESNIEETFNSDTTSAEQPTNSKTENKSSSTNTQTTSSHIHNYSVATCTVPKKCFCGATIGKALGHNYSGEKCTRCGNENPNYEKAETTNTSPVTQPPKEYDTYINGKGYNIGDNVTYKIMIKDKDDWSPYIIVDVLKKDFSTGKAKGDNIENVNSITGFGLDFETNDKYNNSIILLNNNVFAYSGFNEYGASHTVNGYDGICYGMSISDADLSSSEVIDYNIDASNGFKVAQVKFKITEKGNYIVQSFNSRPIDNTPVGDTTVWGELD